MCVLKVRQKALMTYLLHIYVQHCTLFAYIVRTLYCVCIYWPGFRLLLLTWPFSLLSIQKSTISSNWVDLELSGCNRHYMCMRRPMVPFMSPITASSAYYVHYERHQIKCPWMWVRAWTYTQCITYVVRKQHTVPYECYKYIIKALCRSFNAHTLLTFTKIQLFCVIKKRNSLRK